MIYTKDDQPAAGGLPLLQSMFASPMRLFNGILEWDVPVFLGDQVPNYLPAIDALLPDLAEAANAFGRIWIGKGD